MKALSRVRAVVTWLTVLLATVLGSSSARAGTLQVRDELHVLTRDDTARLRAVLASAPFDGRFVVTSAYAERQSFDAYVHSLVSEPNMVVVGVDPEHRHALARFGVGTDIPRAQYQAIERSGTDAFKRGEWESGAAAIFTEAAHAVGEGAGPAAPETRSHSSVPGVLLVLLLAVGAVGIAAYFARRRSLYTPPGEGYGGVPYGGAGFPGGPYGGGPMQGGLGPVGGGLIGAGLGGLAGYELGKMEGEREERGRDRGWEGGGGNDRGDDNFDAGGADSSWDSGGDAGGGGFDGGGGDGGSGSDF